MNRIINRIPLVLIYARLVIGFVILGLSIVHAANYKVFAIVLLSVGLLTDIFDGIIARRINISTIHLRRLDSTIDQVFFLSFILATFFQSPGFFISNEVKLVVLFAAEALAYIVCFMKFGKEIATHSIGSKIWTLVLFVTLIQVTLYANSVALFAICFWLGLLTRLEIIAIILSLKKWTTDVPSFYHSLQLRQGKEIRRHKMFNG